MQPLNGLFMFLGKKQSSKYAIFHIGALQYLHQKFCSFQRLKFRGLFLP